MSKAILNPLKFFALAGLLSVSNKQEAVPKKDATALMCENTTEISIVTEKVDSTIQAIENHKCYWYIDTIDHEKEIEEGQKFISQLAENMVLTKGAKLDIQTSGYVSQHSGKAPVLPEVHMSINKFDLVSRTGDSVLNNVDDRNWFFMLHHSQGF